MDDKEKTVGAILKEARLAKGISLADAEKATSIRSRYLQAVENDEYDKTPGEVFLKGIIRNYGNYLGLNGPELVNEYKASAAGMAAEAVRSQGIREVEKVRLNIQLKDKRDIGSGTGRFEMPGLPKLPMKQCLAVNDISEVVGIVNGTTNYILTKMTEEGMDFSDALEKAQELGFAEADPTSDVEGLDAGRKVAIMASIAFHSRVVFPNVFTEGITKITAKDIEYAKEFDSVIKLLGVAHNTESGIEVGVYPMMIHKEHPLASVRDSFNAVFVHGDAADDAMFYGRGAGEFPTASAVMGDVIDVARNMAYGCNGRISCTCYKNLPVKDIGDVKNKFFIRMQVTNEPGVLAAVAEVFGNHKVSITRVVQEHTQPHQAELVIVTESVKEKYMKQALEELLALPSILEVSSIIREY